MQQEPKHFESLYPDSAWEKELSQLVHYIREGNSSQLIGIAGVGRSSILSLLAYNKDVRLKHFPQNNAIVHFVLTNFSEMRGRPLLDVMKFLFLSLTDSLRERKMQAEYEAVDTIFKESLSYQDELVITQGLKRAIQYLTLEKKLTVIFLFDRFDDYVPFLTAEFFTNLRSLRDIAKYRFSVIFSLSHPLEETLEPDLLSDFSDFVTGHHVYVSLYDKESIAFRVGYLEKLTGKNVDKGILEQIVSLTGGHIRLTKLAVESFLSQGKKNDDLLSFLYEQKTIQSALLSIWRGLTPSEQAFLSAENAEDNQTQVYLQKVGLVEGEKVTIPLLTRFVEEMAEKIKSGEVKICYNEDNNTIIQGEIVLSDSLTKAEFRLLRFLLQHQDQIIDREKLIEVVWQDTATTQGVTEQAVDQLIFRLRRKIETDPNNPSHLLTIKGRGIKFTS